MSQTPDDLLLLTPLQALLYEDGTPARVMQLTGRSYHTVYAWRRGTRRPEPAQARILVEHFDGLTFDGCYEPSLPASEVLSGYVRVRS